MKVELLVGTRYKGEFRPAGKKLDVDSDVGKRWCRNNIAKAKEEVSDDGSVSSICDEGTVGDLSGGDGGEPSNGQPEIADESKRTDSPSNNGKSKSKGK
jgi:hypothetical protein